MCVCVCVLGYFLGNLIGPKTLERYILIVLAVGILAGIVPSVIHLIRSGRHQKQS